MSDRTQDSIGREQGQTGSGQGQTGSGQGQNDAMRLRATVSEDKDDDGDDSSIDARLDTDAMKTAISDVAFFDVDGWQMLVVTDMNNNCVKSFLTRNGHTDRNKLPLDAKPYCIVKHAQDEILVTVTSAYHIARISVHPQLLLRSKIVVRKAYRSLAVLEASQLLAAGSEMCIDILDMEGKVLRLICSHDNEKMFLCPYNICVNSDGELIVSDRRKQSVMCVTSEGRPVWRYGPTGDRSLGVPEGITTTAIGDVLCVDRAAHKVIQLSKAGEFVRELQTLQDALEIPMGICVGENNSIFVAEYYGKLKLLSCSR